MVADVKYLGIDLGGRKISWAVISNGELEQVDHLDLKPTGNRAEELHLCSKAISGFINDIDVICVEEAMVGRGVRASLQIAQNSGHVLGMIGEKSYHNPILVPSGTWKKVVCGNGGLDKQGVATWLEGQHADWFKQCIYTSPRGLRRTNQDRVDAICLALYGEAIAKAAAMALFE